MKKKLISLGISLFLVFSIFFIWMTIASNTFLGPYFKNRSETESVYRQMMIQVEAEESTLINCYRLSETTYVAQVSYQSQELLIWFNDQLQLLAKREASLFQTEAAKRLAEELGLSNYTMTLGYYDNRPMIVLSDDEQEVLLDFDYLDVALTYKKKVV